jgi:hypothetical protein
MLPNGNMFIKMQNLFEWQGMLSSAFHKYIISLSNMNADDGVTAVLKVNDAKKCRFRAK